MRREQMGRRRRRDGTTGEKTVMEGVEKERDDHS